MIRDEEADRIQKRERFPLKSIAYLEANYGLGVLW
jgi:hypothetical protein